jgi:hypothetical protein
MEHLMKIINLYYNHGTVAYVEFNDNGSTKMLSLDHFIKRYGQEILDELSSNAA